MYGVIDVKKLLKRRTNFTNYIKMIITKWFELSTCSVFCNNQPKI